jgi:hypothetical protein
MIELKTIVFTILTNVNTIDNSCGMKRIRRDFYAGSTGIYRGYTF